MSVETDSQHERRRRYPLAKVKGGWTSAEDQILKRLVEEFGEGNWSVIARHLNAALGKPADSGRIGKQCRERYNHHLRPDIKKDAWTEEEESLLVEAHLRYGNRWSDIAKVIKGRTENAVKNHWNATLRRKDNDKCGSRGNGATQSCVLKDYMIRIALLPGPAAGSAGSTETAAAPVPDFSRLEAASGPDTEPPRVHSAQAAAASASVTGTQTCAKRMRAGGIGQGDCEYMAPNTAAQALNGGNDAPEAEGEAVVAATKADEDLSPCSSCSSHEGLVGVHPRRSFEAPAAPSQLAKAPAATSVPWPPAAPQTHAPAVVRKRPRIITFAAVGPAAALAAAVDNVALTAGREFPSEARGGGGSSCRGSGTAMATAADTAVSKHRLILQQQPRQPTQMVDTAQLVAGAAALRSQPTGKPRQHRRGDRQPGWATDSAEESAHGSPMSEHFEGFEEDEGEDAAGCMEDCRQELGADGQAACSEVQAAQIMLALKSLAGSL